MPENEMPSWPDPAFADVMPTPGALISGFKALEGEAGPRELLSSSVSTNSGRSIMMFASSVTVTVSLSRALRSAPSAFEIMPPGISIPPESPPMMMGAVSTLLTITTAIAPTACALRILSTKKQVPRSISAILPLSAAAFDGVPQARFGL